MDDDSQPQLIAIQNKKYQNKSYRYCNIKSNLCLSIQYLWLNLTVITLYNSIYLNKEDRRGNEKKFIKLSNPQGTKHTKNKRSIQKLVRMYLSQKLLHLFCIHFDIFRIFNLKNKNFKIKCKWKNSTEKETEIIFVAQHYSLSAFQ